MGRGSRWGEDEEDGERMGRGWGEDGERMGRGWGEDGERMGRGWGEDGERMGRGWGEDGERMGRGWGEDGERMGRGWGEDGERMGRGWGEDGERMGRGWGEDGERMGRGWGEDGERMGRGWGEDEDGERTEKGRREDGDSQKQRTEKGRGEYKKRRRKKCGVDRDGGPRRDTVMTEKTTRRTSTAEGRVLQNLGAVGRHGVRPARRADARYVRQVVVDSLEVVVHSDGKNLLRKVLPDDVAVEVVVDLRRKPTTALLTHQTVVHPGRGFCKRDVVGFIRNFFVESTTRKLQK